MSYNDVSNEAILSEIGSVGTGAEEAVSSPESPQESPVAATQIPQAPQESPKSYEFNWNGQMIRGSEDQLVKWASQGYDYSQKMSGLNQKEQEFQSLYSKYQQIDQFAKQNPDWWAHTENSYKARETYNLPPEFQKALDPLLTELNTVKQFVNEHQKAQIEKEAKEHDNRLAEEIGGLQKKYPDVDFASRDNAGQSLEYRVIKHANERGIPNFTAAFLDYYHDSLATIFEARGRSAVEQDLKKRREQGLLGKAPAPRSSDLFPNAQPRNYEEAHKMALKEFGL